ncbi:MAG: hypothetical protein H6645_12940 [Caldilineaceae bacterium]|nr:hypothetical protein [Caldilineaceae bacterium]
MNSNLQQRANLEIMADGIEDVLAANRIVAKVIGGTVSHRLIKFDLTTSASIDQLRPLAGAIAARLSAGEVRIYNDAGAISLEMPVPEPRLMRITQLMEEIGTVPPQTAILGKDTKGMPLLLRIDGNVLIAGDTGSGKTALLRTMAASLAYYNRNLNFVIVDPKIRGLKVLSRLPNANFFECAQDAWRYAANQIAPTVVVVDEISDCGGIPDGLFNISNLHIIASTQKAKLFNSGLYRTHIAGEMKDGYFPGTSKLMGRGDMLMFYRNEQIRFQSAWLGANEMKELVAEVWQ